MELYEEVLQHLRVADDQMRAIRSNHEHIADNPDGLDIGAHYDQVAQAHGDLNDRLSGVQLAAISQLGKLGEWKLCEDAIYAAGVGDWMYPAIMSYAAKYADRRVYERGEVE